MLYTKPMFYVIDPRSGSLITVTHPLASLNKVHHFKHAEAMNAELLRATHLPKSKCNANPNSCDSIVVQRRM